MKRMTKGIKMAESSNILTMRVDVTEQSLVVRRIQQLIDLKDSSYICVSNVHMCMETFDSPLFRQVVNNADLVIADGRPIYWAQKLLGNKDAKQVRGQDITNALCKLSAEMDIRIGLYGGSSDDVLSKVVSNLNTQYPNIKIVYTFSPPFRPLTSEESEQVVTDVNASQVDVLFVGIGCPKQEIWMAQNKGKINAVMLGVGAAYDFIAGTKKHAPQWMQKLGLEWLFRLISEPRRLWKRYLKQNPRFIYYFILQCLFKKKFN
jgi:N-acetylglucosaminyldiphosphoundecaprenol N-acetyl-beta-D-mannosaminyltransferase